VDSTCPFDRMASAPDVETLFVSARVVAGIRDWSLTTGYSSGNFVGGACLIPAGFSVTIPFSFFSSSKTRNLKRFGLKRHLQPCG